MTHLLQLDVTFPKISSKKSMKSLSDRFVQLSVVRKIDAEKILTLSKEETVLELAHGLTVTFHNEGCFHFTCKDLSEQKVKLIRKALPVLAEIFDIGKESEEIEIALFMLEDKFSCSKIAKMVNKGVSSDLRTQIKNLYQKDIKVGGIRFVCQPDMSCILDISGISTRIGPRKMTLDKLKDGNVIIELIEESLGKIKKISGA